MATIIAGEFATMADAESVVAALKGANFAADDVDMFMLNAPGQHDLHPLGGDEDADARASHAHSGALSGAVIGATVGFGAGAAAMAATEAGPAIAATVAAVGAYTGSLVGALNKVGEDEAPQAPETVRHAGAMVAVNAISAAAIDEAISVMRARGAKQVEQAEGRWENGKWQDFDPRATPHLVSDNPGERVPQAADRASPSH